MASSKLHVSGYRPLVTRLIGQGDEPAEKAQPVMPRLSAEEGWGIDQVEPPPPGGYSNYTDYPTEEVILEDLWRDGAPDRPPPHKLPPPPPQPDANFSFAFAVEFSPAKNLTLTSPTRLIHEDAPYDFAGFLVLCHYEVSVPELQKKVRPELVGEIKSRASWIADCGALAAKTSGERDYRANAHPSLANEIKMKRPSIERGPSVLRAQMHEVAAA